MECVQLVSDQQFCGGKITKAQGEIMTPNWPDKKYPPGTSCSWLITVEPDRVCLTLTPSMQNILFSKVFYTHKENNWSIKVTFLFCSVSGYQVIQVKFDKFVLEADTYCRFDYVAFFNGGEKDDSRLIGKYCGDEAPQWVR